jgi:hypothetical protein
MAIVGSKFYNNPQLGAAFEGIASMFAPPGAADLANYGLARERNQRSDIVAQLAKDPRYAGFDHQAILADLYDPTQSFYRVDADDATTRRGQDVAARTSITNNELDNRTSLLGTMFGTVAQDAMRPALPPEIAGLYGLPGLPEVQGNVGPLSETELNAQVRQRLLLEGDLTDDDFVAEFLGQIPIENVVGEGGVPEIVRRPDAVGRQPHFNKGAEAKGDLYNYVTPDGREGAAVFDGATLVDAATKEPLPEGVKVYKASAQGTTDELGMSTNSNRTDAQRLRASVANTNSLVNELEEIVRSNPATTGLAGDILSFVQDSKQVVAELAEAFGDNPDAPISAEDMQSIAARVLGADNGTYNPAFRQARALLLELAYANASMNNPSGEVSRFALERELEALGQGMMGNDEGVLAIVKIARDRMKRKLLQADVLDRSADPLTPDQIGPAAEEEWVRDPATGKLVRAGG